MGRIGEPNHGDIVRKKVVSAKREREGCDVDVGSEEKRNETSSLEIIFDDDNRSQRQ